MAVDGKQVDKLEENNKTVEVEKNVSVENFDF